ncbi:protein of unknown function [Methylococcus capsulatus]|uniref:Uncharacterized protein n=1 Tax=Methylococcus capsulatus TaxID=414 RepID=A0AA35US02_METCP|nr:protein of unknown function [Methylococcus capsulatus]
MAVGPREGSDGFIASAKDDRWFLSKRETRFVPVRSEAKPLNHLKTVGIPSGRWWKSTLGIWGFQPAIELPRLGLLSVDLPSRNIPEYRHLPEPFRQSHPKETRGRT